MVPCTMVPFLSSIETVSLFNFIKNLLISKIRYQVCITEGKKKAQLLDAYEIKLTREQKLYRKQF